MDLDVAAVLCPCLPAAVGMMMHDASCWHAFLRTCFINVFCFSSNETTDESLWPKMMGVCWGFPGSDACKHEVSARDRIRDWSEETFTRLWAKSAILTQSVAILSHGNAWRFAAAPRTSFVAKGYSWRETLIPHDLQVSVCIWMAGINRNATAVSSFQAHRPAAEFLVQLAHNLASSSFSGNPIGIRHKLQSTKKAPSRWKTLQFSVEWPWSPWVRTEIFMMVYV